MILKKIRDLDPLVHFLFLVAILVLVTAYFLLKREIAGINSRLALTSVQPQVIEKVPAKGCGDECQKEIKKIVSDAIATIAAVPKTIIKKETATAPSSSKTTYIPLGGSAVTTSTDWSDAAGIQTTIDVGDYGKNPAISWEASLKVANGNGTAYARLYDDTHKIAVSGSEISTVDNSSFKLVTSGNLNLWAGKNVYKVQLKSLNSFEVTFSGGRIKINYQ